MTYEPVRSPRHDCVSIRGLKHRLTWWGNPAQTPIVLLHGFMDCGDTWQFLVDSLPESWSLVAPDWRGFGGSEWAPGGYWFPDYLADLDSLLDLVAPGGRARIIGHSMGANIAALYAGVRPERVQWLVNLEGLGLQRTKPDDAPVRYARWLDELREPLRENRYGSVEDLAAVLQQRNPRLSAERADFVARAWSQPADGAGPCAGDTGRADRDAADADGGEVRLAFDPRHRFVNPVLYRLEEAEACWARVEVPVLLLTGGSSGHRQRRLEEGIDDRFRKLFRELRILTLPGLGHMMHHEDPQAVAHPIIDFVRAQSQFPREPA